MIARLSLDRTSIKFQDQLRDLRFTYCFLGRDFGVSNDSCDSNWKWVEIEIDLDSRSKVNFNNGKKIFCKKDDEKEKGEEIENKKAKILIGMKKEI